MFLDGSMERISVVEIIAKSLIKMAQYINIIFDIDHTNIFLLSIIKIDNKKWLWCEGTGILDPDFFLLMRKILCSIWIIYKKRII